MELETLREIIYPGLYRHFKNRFYATMGISKPAPKSFLQDIVDKDCEMFYVHQAGATRDFMVYKFKGEYYHNKSRNHTFVLYKTLFDDSGVYARVYEDFIGLVDKEKYPDVNQKYRYELVRN